MSTGSVPLKKIYSLLESSKLDRNEKALRDAYQLFSKMEDTPPTTQQSSSPDAETYVIIAEIALDFPSCIEIATACVDKYLGLPVKRQKKDSVARASLVKASVLFLTAEQPISMVCAIAYTTHILDECTKRNYVDTSSHH